MAPGQQLIGETTQAHFYGDIVISGKQSSVKNLVVDGTIFIRGAQAPNVTIENVIARGGVKVLPLGQGVINVDGLSITAVSGSPYPVVIAHATGKISVTCTPGTTAVIQPAGRAAFSATYTDCSTPILDIGELFNVFGVDLEQTEFGATPEPPSLFLTTYWRTALAVTVVGFVIKYVGQP
jgi:hypothetical protein